VFSHVRFHRVPDIAAAVKIGRGQADAVIACDLVAGVHPECLDTISEATHVVANADVTATADFQVSGNSVIDPDALIGRLARAARREPQTVSATRMAERLFGDAIAANMLMLGFA